MKLTPKDVRKIMKEIQLYDGKYPKAKTRQKVADEELVRQIFYELLESNAVRNGHVPTFVLDELENILREKLLGVVPKPKPEPEPQVADEDLVFRLIAKVVETGMPTLLYRAPLGERKFREDLEEMFSQELLGVVPKTPEPQLEVHRQMIPDLYMSKYAKLQNELAAVQAERDTLQAQLAEAKAEQPDPPEFATQKELDAFRYSVINANNRIRASIEKLATQKDLEALRNDERIDELKTIASQRFDLIKAAREQAAARIEKLENTIKSHLEQPELATREELVAEIIVIYENIKKLANQKDLEALRNMVAEGFDANDERLEELERLFGNLEEQNVEELAAAVTALWDKEREEQDDAD